MPLSSRSKYDVDELEIVPLAHPLAASIRVPGSKSITNRALLLAAMAGGRSILSGVGLNDDTRRMAAALVTLGFELAVDEAAARIVVTGHSGAIPARGRELDGNRRIRHGSYIRRRSSRGKGCGVAIDISQRMSGALSQKSE